MATWSRSACLASRARFALPIALLQLACCVADESHGGPALDASLLAPGALEGGSDTADGAPGARRDGGVDLSGMDASRGVIEAGPAVEGEVGRLAGITSAHNAARARVVTTPRLPPLTWSPAVAAVAQAYANELAAACADTLLHSSSDARHGYGENLASFAITGGSGAEPTGSAARVVELWESELQCYTYGPFQSGINATCSAGCADYGGCGHYTQLVWRETERVGCGVADCTLGRARKSYWVCNYDPPGNFVDDKPY